MQEFLVKYEHIRQTGRYYIWTFIELTESAMWSLGHGGSGKTTLAEAMAYLAGMTNRLGRVEDGNTVSDFDKEEIKRHFSVSTTLIPVPWDKVKVNVLDTPGYFDFVGEVEEAVSAADAAIIVVSG